MTTSLNTLLDHLRSHSKTEREKGTYFEELSKVFLENDPVQISQYEEVTTYSNWAEKHGFNKGDAGIDLVAKLRDEDSYCAIQCKFYSEDHAILKGDIDSFFTASGKTHFTRRLIIDSTRAPWSKHAEDALDNQNPPVTRIGLSDLAESPIDWNIYFKDQKVVLSDKKSLRPHQTEALQAVRDGFENADRGKLIMACGTGKTFTGLKIAEDLAGAGKSVLFLVPSLSLMSQTVKEWTIDAGIPLRSFAVCSDTQVGRRRRSDDFGDLDIHDLAFPATTDATKLALKINAHSAPEEMTVVFSTYQSIQVIAEAQSAHGLAEFDLIICDEAHRTTGAILAGEDESNFVKIHNQDFIQGKKRLYMTATPRVFGEAVTAAAQEASVELCSMDDEKLYGEVLFERGFSWAVQKGLLADYKVIVLAVDEATVSANIQNRLTNEHGELELDDVTKIVGCYKALTKLDIQRDVETDPLPMKRALAFCKSIKSSELIRDQFANVVEEYLESGNVMDGYPADTYTLSCETEHVDGTYKAKERTQALDWLKEDTDEHTCRILSNARCLSEGVDVPSLDAIMFLHPRKSQIDVVQSVGRVMRRAEGKKMGYVILPVGIPAGVSPEDALNVNEKYKVIWQILNALRSHDDRFDATLNKMDLGVDVSGKIEVIAVTNQLPNKTKPDEEQAGIGGEGSSDDKSKDYDPQNDYKQTSFVFDEIASAILAKIVKKCGRRNYWEDWAGDIGKIAQINITRIKALLDDETNVEERRVFSAFLDEIRDDLNGGISKTDAIEMLAQHIITQPVFEALFEGYSFAKNNPVSKSMQKVLDILDAQHLETEAKSLKKFYDSVKLRAEGIDNAEGKQKIIKELYEKFFQKAFPSLVERMGIVYTPIEVIDFIIHSVNDVLKKEFDQTLGSKGVHILDPFTGTGTFITRLLQSGLIQPDELTYKYENDIHANEIVLLAYYIAAINIEATYHGLVEDEYKSFNGICLCDTFDLFERDDAVRDLFPENSDRRNKLKQLTDIRVIMGNPPYSAGQKDANDNAANVVYKNLDQTIRDSYAAHSKATLKNSLYDSYIRAMRWGSDRLGDSGIMAYVSNAGWLDGNAMDGLRKCLAEDYSNIYVFHLRGNQRTSGEKSRQEGGKIFGSGSRAPIAISLFVKNPKASTHGNIYFHDIGDYLSQQEKLTKISDFKSIEGIAEIDGWQKIEPDKHNDWLNQRDDSFDQFIEMGNKREKATVGLFVNYSSGVKTNRDAWCYNASKSNVGQNMERMIEFYHDEVRRYSSLQLSEDPKMFIDKDPKKISWDVAQVNGVKSGRLEEYRESAIVKSIYRPFFKEWLYYDKFFNNRTYQMPKIFPNDQVENRVIAVTGVGAQEFSILMVDKLPCLDMVSKGQCFPLNLYDEAEPSSFGGLFSKKEDGCNYSRNDGMTDEGLAHFQLAYPDENISKEDIFYYIYGLLHSADYRTRYADNLSRQLPRIPCVKTYADFETFSRAGRDLAELHLNYESVEPYAVTYKEGAIELSNFTDSDYRVEKMRFAGKRPNLDKTTVIYNHKITMTDIPLEAYDYVVNGKPALEWVMERQCVSVDKHNPEKNKGSGIVNDANLYATETVGEADYPLKLFQRVITVSLETMKIVNALPELDIEVN